MSVLSSQQTLMTGHLCRAMATMLASGLSPVQAMQTLLMQADSPQFADNCAKAVNALQQGLTLTEVWSQFRFFSRYQIVQLNVAELAGAMPQALLRLASQLERQNERNSRLKIQLRLSQTVILIALGVSVVLALLKGHGVLASLCALLVIAVATKALLDLLKLDMFYLLTLVWRSGGIKHISLNQRFFEYHWYNLLTMQLKAGIDACQALTNQLELIDAPVYRNNVRACSKWLYEGQSLTLALKRSGLVFTTELKQVLSIGEKSGRLDETLTGHLQREEQYLELIVSSFYEWLPRFYYLLVVSVLLSFAF